MDTITYKKKNLGIFLIILSFFLAIWFPWLTSILNAEKYNYELFPTGLRLILGLNALLVVILDIFAIAAAMYGMRILYTRKERTQARKIKYIILTIVLVLVIGAGWWVK